jgi:hypothetical protein
MLFPDRIDTDNLGRDVHVQVHVFTETRETHLGGGATSTSTGLHHC